MTQPAEGPRRPPATATAQRGPQLEAAAGSAGGDTSAPAVFNCTDSREASTPARDAAIAALTEGGRFTVGTVAAWFDTTRTEVYRAVARDEARRARTESDDGI